MKQKIFDSLKATYAGKYGVGDEVLMGQAEALAATGLITEENLGAAVAGQEHVFRAIQSKFDKANSTKTELEKQLEELKKSIPSTPPDAVHPTEKPSDMEAMLKELMGMVKGDVSSLKSDLTEMREMRAQLEKERLTKEACAKLEQEIRVNDYNRKAIEKVIDVVNRLNPAITDANELAKLYKEEYVDWADRTGSTVSYTPQSSSGGGHASVVSDVVKTSMARIKEKTTPIS